jgi:EAL domain-containing protein (putative c-di-GMP-specific phosphodiesterase class I)/CheY-like chemotaxis protein
MTLAPTPVPPPSLQPDDLRDALACNEIEVAFQPLVGLRYGEVRSLEALARWEHPTHGAVAPAIFVPLAEQSGQSTRLSFAVLRHVARELPSWRAQAPEIRAAVNVSLETMCDPAFPGQLETFLAATGCAGDWFELELTESAFSRDPVGTKHAVAAVRTLGFRVAICNFGRGYSSLGQLATLPLSAVKIDPQFVRSMSADHRREAVVRATIALAHDLGFEVVAESVDDRDTGELLAALGCDVVQGAYVAQPMPAADVAGWLTAWSAGRAEIGEQLVPDPTGTAAGTAVRRILVVDDELAIAEMIRDILTERGFQVLVAANGAEALRVVEQTAIDVVLLDMNMPVLDGAGFVAAIRERGLRIPIVVMTAGPSAQRWAKELQADGYLSKPFDIDHLVDVTTRLVATVVRGLAAVAPSHAPIRVVLADDHPAIRSALRALFATDSAISVVGEASDGQEALALVDQLAPDVVILDNHMPILTGVEVARRLHAQPGPHPAIVFFSSEAVPADAAEQADRSLVKDAAAWDIVRVVHEVAEQR